MQPTKLKKTAIFSKQNKTLHDLSSNPAINYTFPITFPNQIVEWSAKGKTELTPNFRSKNGNKNKCHQPWLCPTQKTATRKQLWLMKWKWMREKWWTVSQYIKTSNFVSVIPYLNASKNLRFLVTQTRFHMKRMNENKDWRLPVSPLDLQLGFNEENRCRFWAARRSSRDSFLSLLWFSAEVLLTAHSLASSFLFFQNPCCQSLACFVFPSDFLAITQCPAPFLSAFSRSRLSYLSFPQPFTPSLASVFFFAFQLSPQFFP